MTTQTRWKLSATSQIQVYIGGKPNLKNIAYIYKEGELLKDFFDILCM